MTDQEAFDILEGAIGMIEGEWGEGDGSEGSALSHIRARLTTAEQERDKALGQLHYVPDEWRYTGRLHAAEARVEAAEEWLPGLEETFAAKNCAHADPGEDNTCLNAEEGDLEFPDDWCERCYVLLVVRRARAALACPPQQDPPAANSPSEEKK